MQLQDLENSLFKIRNENKQQIMMKYADKKIFLHWHLKNFTTVEDIFILLKINKEKQM